MAKLTHFIVFLSHLKGLLPKLSFLPKFNDLQTIFSQ